MSKGIELKDDELEKFIHGGQRLRVTNGGPFRNAKVWDESGRCIYDTYRSKDAEKWAFKHAAIGDTICTGYDGDDFGACDSGYTKWQEYLKEEEGKVRNLHRWLSREGPEGPDYISY